MAKEKYLYLYHYPGISYNNRVQEYTLESVKDSAVTRCVAFCGGANIGRDRLGELYLLIETTEPVVHKNSFLNRTRFENIISLVSDLPINARHISIKDQSFEEVLKENMHNVYYNPKISVSNMHADKLQILPTIFSLLNRLSNEQVDKFDNIVMTWAMAKKLEYMPNPHLWYSLYMTVYSAVINQVADNPKKECGGMLICNICGFSTIHLGTGHLEEMRRLAIKYVPEEQRADVIEYIESANYNRSSFLHGGELFGLEKLNGFMGDFDASTTPEELSLITTQMNLPRISKHLLLAWLNSVAEPQ